MIVVLMLFCSDLVTGDGFGCGFDRSNDDDGDGWWFWTTFVSRVKHGENSSFSNPFGFLRDYKFSRQSSAKNTKTLHAHLLITRDLQSNIFLMNSLLDLYCKSTDMVVSRKLFDTTALPNLVSWNIMISGFDHNQMFEKSLKMFCRMHLLGVEPMSLVIGVFFRPLVLCELQYFANKFIHLLWKMILFPVVMLLLEW